MAESAFVFVPSLRNSYCSRESMKLEMEQTGYATIWNSARFQVPDSLDRRGRRLTAGRDLNPQQASGGLCARLGSQHRLCVAEPTRSTGTWPKENRISAVAEGRLIALLSMHVSLGNAVTGVGVLPAARARIELLLCGSTSNLSTHYRIQIDGFHQEIPAHKRPSRGK